MRFYELLSIRRYLENVANILEIGGGSGFQAMCLKMRGYNYTISVD